MFWFLVPRPGRWRGFLFEKVAWYWNIYLLALKLKTMNVGSFEITKYGFEMVDGDPKIVISMVKVLDVNGKYIKFAKLNDVEKYLSKYPVTFKIK